MTNFNLAAGCHYFPPGLRLPSQPKSVTAHWPVPNYTAWCQRHMRVSSLPKAVTWKRTAAEIRTRDLLDRESERSTVTPHSIKTVQKLKPRGRTQSCVSSLAVSLRSGTAYITNGRAAAAAAAAGGGIRQPACTVCLREPVAKQTGRRPGWSPVQRVGVCVCANRASTGR